jgi:hypothetical protein
MNLECATFQDLEASEAIQVFEEYDFKLKIKSTIAMPSAPRLNNFRGTNWDRIYEFLQDKG